MTNHVHLLITQTPAHGISRVLQDTGRKYVGYVNRTYGCAGTLREGRYRSCLIDSEPWLLSCMRYIEMNPVRAGMVAHPGEYRWSSYAVNACCATSRIISPHTLYLELGNSANARTDA